jgi:hypothetical protein
MPKHCCQGRPVPISDCASATAAVPTGRSGASQHERRDETGPFRLDRGTTQTDTGGKGAGPIGSTDRPAPPQPSRLSEEE